MSSNRTTNTQCLWLTLLVAFALYVTDGISSVGNESQAFGGELEIKSVALEPDNNDNPAIWIQNHRNRPILLVDDRAPAVDALTARNEADRPILIRGPPVGYPTPA